MIKKIMIIVSMALVLFIVDTLNHAGSFKTIVSHSDLTNIKIDTHIAGTEDLDIDREKGLLFISSSDRWNEGKVDSTEDGIYTLDLNDESAVPIKLTTTYTGDFHPHGIHYLKKETANYLFAVNHNINGDFIEVFQYEDNLLTHIKSYSNQLLCCPNDLVAVDVDKFYVTNDHGAAKGFARIAEDYLRIANSYVLYFDGSRFKKVLENVLYINGVNLSNDGKTLYATEASGGRVFVMDRNTHTGDLTFRFSKALDTGADNISVDEQGHLWIGAHPQLLKFVAHSSNPQKNSPSQVLRLIHKGSNDFDVKEVYLNAGEELSGSSVALRYKNEVFVGVVFESKLLKGQFNE